MKILKILILFLIENFYIFWNILEMTRKSWVGSENSRKFSKFLYFLRKLKKLLENGKFSNKLKHFYRTEEIKEYFVFKIEKNFRKFKKFLKNIFKKTWSNF